MLVLFLAEVDPRYRRHGWDATGGGRYGVWWCRSAAPLIPFQFISFSFGLEDELVIFVE
jgi:hypothetical protein